MGPEVPDGVWDRDRDEIKHRLYFPFLRSVSMFRFDFDTCSRAGSLGLAGLRYLQREAGQSAGRRYDYGVSVSLRSYFLVKVNANF